MTNNEISGVIVDAALKVHSQLGPGLLESAYEKCLLYELHKRGLQAQAQVEVPVLYDEIKIDAGFRLDLVVENTVIVELKAVEAVLPIHHAQILTYLKLSGKPIGLLINFNVQHLRDGIKRFVKKT